jgi:thiol-disulfide isomerase/thioredoxin
MIRRRPSQIVLLVLAAIAVLGQLLHASESLNTSSVLHLTDGDFFSGTLTDSTALDTISWQSDGAEQPFQFPASAIRAAYFPPPANPAPAKADYCFELSDGDLIFGKLLGIAGDTLEIDSDRFGRLHVARSQLRRLVPWQGSTAWEYSGPNGLSEWTVRPKKNTWREEAGHLISDGKGESIRNLVKIPDQASIEVAISWTKKPDFVFILSSGSSKRRQDAGIHLEIWNTKLVIVRETKSDADVASLLDLKDVQNRLHLRLLLDQAKGSVSVHLLNGEKLAEIQVDAGDDEALQLVALRNNRGDVRLEQLIVGKWNGQLPPQVDVDRERIHKTDGSIAYGSIERYDADARQFTLKDDTAEATVPVDDVSLIVFKPATEARTQALRIGCHDGTRVSGQLTNVESNNLHIKRIGIEEELRFALEDVRCLIGPTAQPLNDADQTKLGRLELSGVQSHGSLVDGKATDSISCLVWQPRQSTTSSSLKKDVSGRIVYRDPPAPVEIKPALRGQQQPRRGVWGAVVQAFSGPPPEPVATAPPRLSGYPHALFLMAGDRIPCIVSRIDDRGVHFTSSVVESEMVPHAQIKALELVSRTAAASLAEEKRLRLLTLPRVQKNNPPTHLIASTGGDYLRARLESMDGQTLSAETRLEIKRLPRGRIASIIWLHPPKESEQEKEAEAPDAATMRVQAVRADGVRLTFVPSEFANNALIGSSLLLGACHVDLKAVDRLLLGDRIEESSEQSLYDAWQLYDAVEPQFVNDDSSDSGKVAAATGLNSAMIGKPAPDFRLDLLEGGRFRLSEEKGNVVILDFWASWCAPCMQGIPEINAVVEELKNDKIKYIAVNMQEDNATASAALERLRLSVPVAMDIDGAAAQRYEVSAIPQVVVIDHEGNVARMFIGVDMNFADDLRQALKQLTGAEQPAETEPSGS